MKGTWKRVLSLSLTLSAVFLMGIAISLSAKNHQLQGLDALQIRNILDPSDRLTKSDLWAGLF